MYQKKVRESKFLGVWGEGWMLIGSGGRSEGGRKGTLLAAGSCASQGHRPSPRATARARPYYIRRLFLSQQIEDCSTRATQASPPGIHSQPAPTRLGTQISGLG